MNMLNKILRKISELKKIFIERVLIINYEKIDDLPDIKAGYIDIKTVAKRYMFSSKGMNVEELLRQPPIRDSFYFLEIENRKYFKDISNSYKLLDVGCGSGVYAKVFKRLESIFKDIQYIGCEIEKEIVNVCKEINPENDFFVSYADNISAKNNEYDMVFCSGTLHYTLSNWKKSIEEMARVAKKNIAIVRFPVTKYNKTFFVHQNVKGINGTENHYFIVINRGELENYFLELGLKVVGRDYSLEEYNIEGVEEKIILVQYLLEKNGN